MGGYAWFMICFCISGALWSVLVVWPFMKVTKRAAVEGLAASNRLANLLAGIPLERLNSLLDAAEKLLVHKAEPSKGGADSAPVPPPAIQPQDDQDVEFKLD